MRLYNTTNNNSLQTLKKYCIQLDRRINTIKRFIDNFNANYIVLNLPDAHSPARFYFSDSQLEQIGILIKEGTNYKYINPEKMTTHQVIDNTYQRDLFIYTSDEEKPLIPQGFAVRHDGYNTDQTVNYSIIPLANSGSYYTINNFIVTSIEANKTNCRIDWVHTENATDLYGLTYLISLVKPGSRFYYHNPDGLYTFSPSPMYLFNFTATPTEQNIATSNNGLWTTQYLLGHEMLNITTTSSKDSYEEVFDDCSVKTEQVRVGEYPQSRYIIYTNMQNGILSNLKINLY